MIPGLYFEYLKTGDARPLRSVFYHNEVDIVSLAALLNQLVGIIEKPLENPNQHSLELVAVGKLYQDIGKTEMATKIYQVALGRDDLPDEIFWDTNKRLSFLYKRQGDLRAALAIWEKSASHGYIYACEEIAKYFEHQERNFYHALAWTDRALEILASHPDAAIQRVLWRDAFEYRKTRLERKCQADTT
jgi:tetratricopeptide (TPR) repeat protein